MAVWMRSRNLRGSSDLWVQVQKEVAVVCTRSRSLYGISDLWVHVQGEVAGVYANNRCLHGCVCEATLHV